MAENTTTEPVVENNNTTVQNNDEFIQKLDEIKKGMVNKEDFDKLAEDNKKLREALMNSLNQSANEPSKSAEELAKEYLDLASKGADSLTMAKKTLEYRNQMLKETDGKVDVFMNKALRKTNPNSGEMLATFLTKAIEESDGHPAMFSAFFKTHLGGTDLPK